MDKRSFSMQVETGAPIVIATPYGTPLQQIINIILASLQRSQIRNIYVDRQYDIEDIPVPIYEHGPGVIIMSVTPDNIPYNRYITPIYIVEWGIRNSTLQNFIQWINPIEHITLMPSFLPERQSPSIIPHYSLLTPNHYEVGVNDQMRLNMTYPGYVGARPDTTVASGGWITDDIINHLIDYSPKIASLIEHITIPNRHEWTLLTRCIIYSRYIDRYGLTFIREILKRLGVPIYSVYSETDIRNLQLFLAHRTGILLTNNCNIFNSIPPEVPVHILNLDSTQGLDLVIDSHYHYDIHIYIALGPNNEATADSDQYRLLVEAINDCNIVYQRLLSTSVPITIDRYNNLYVT